MDKRTVASAHERIAPDAPASGETDIYVFWTRDGGTTWYGVQSIDAAA